MVRRRRRVADLHVYGGRYWVRICFGTVSRYWVWTAKTPSDQRFRQPV